MTVCTIPWSHDHNLLWFLFLLLLGFFCCFLAKNILFGRRGLLNILPVCLMTDLLNKHVDVLNNHCVNCWKNRLGHMGALAYNATTYNWISSPICGCKSRTTCTSKLYSLAMLVSKSKQRLATKFQTIFANGSDILAKFILKKMILEMPSKCRIQ